MADPFTIRIFVPDGDPEGVRLIDRMNWTGLGLVFRRSDWSEVRKRTETQPVSAITHYAPGSRIEPYGESGKYKLVFSESAKPIGPIPYGDAPQGAMQGPRYTSFSRLQKARKLTEVLGKS